MITLDLKTQFSELARSDHFHRVEVVLIELDLGYGYSLLPDFKQRMAIYSSQLEDLGFLSAYQQACTLFCLFIQCVSIDFISRLECKGTALKACLSLALEREVSATVFEQVHFKLAGIVKLYEVWVEPIGEPDGLYGSSVSKPFPSLLQLSCDYEGLVVESPKLLMNDEVNHFRTTSGFQHQVAGDFTLIELIKYACQFALPSESSIFSPHPVLERCELGNLRNAQFERLQCIELIDARQVQFNFSKRSFECSASDLIRLERRWRDVPFLSAPQIQLHKPFASCDMQFKAGWQQSDKNYEFRTLGNACVEIPQAAIQWHASLVHGGVLVHLILQTNQNLNVQWSLDESWAQGQLPVGNHFLVREYSVPLIVSCSSVVTVGQSMLSAVENVAGQLKVSLIGNLNAESLQLELTLLISHSELSCNWQFTDVLQGRTTGNWALLPQASVTSWNLMHG